MYYFQRIALLLEASLPRGCAVLSTGKVMGCIQQLEPLWKARIRRREDGTRSSTEGLDGIQLFNSNRKDQYHRHEVFITV